MKKIISLCLVLTAAVFSFACGTDDDEVDGMTGASPQTDDDDEGRAHGKMLVVYFSRADENWQVGYVERGNTAIMVDYIKEFANVDVFEIVPEVAYPAAYNDCIDYVTTEINENRRPAYKNDLGTIDDYETIFIGGPIWWGRPPMLIRTFCEAHPELDGKTLIPFGTHGGSGVGSYTTLLKEYYPKATLLESLGISGASVRDASSKTTVENWLNRLGADKAHTRIAATSLDGTSNESAYTLDGTRTNVQRGLFIRNHKKYIRQ